MSKVFVSEGDSEGIFLISFTENKDKDLVSLDYEENELNAIISLVDQALVKAGVIDEENERHFILVWVIHSE